MHALELNVLVYRHAERQCRVSRQRPLQASQYFRGFLSGERPDTGDDQVDGLARFYISLHQQFLVASITGKGW